MIATTKEITECLNLEHEMESKIENELKFITILAIKAYSHFQGGGL